MKKIRYVPYGYTVRNGAMVVASDEAKIVKEIFDQYIDGASLKDIAESLTARQVPYTEKTTVWDKARIARIIDNAKYIGTQEFEPIIEEETFQYATNAKIARQRGTTERVNTAVDAIRHTVRCGNCGNEMIRRTCQKCRVKESWVCSNPECEMRVRISDESLLNKVQIIINRIIRNTALLIPCGRTSKDFASPEINELNVLLDKEMEKDTPSEDVILSLIQSIATAKYAHSDAKDEIALSLARKRMTMLKESEEFQTNAFQDIVRTITLCEDGTIIVNTKTEANIKENTDGS